MVAPAINQVTDLINLAYDKTEAGRLLLAERLADFLFSDIIALTSREEKLVNDLINELLKTEHETVRYAIISRFASNIDVSNKIAMRISQAPYEIAKDVLKYNEQLEDNDLITIVARKGVRHAKAIALRKDISEAVADALVETGDIQVMKVIAENLGAKLSTRALEVLIESARLSSLLQKPILDRKELTRESAAHLFWWTSHDLRKTTLERFGFGPGRLDEELNKVVDDMLTAHSLQKDDSQSMNDLADWMADRGALNIDSLSRFLRAGHFKLFNITLSRISKIDLAAINHITADKEGRMMSALCRAIGLEKGKFISIYLMARGAHCEDEAMNPKELSRVLEVYERLTLENSKAMLTTWSQDPKSVLAG